MKPITRYALSPGMKQPTPTATRIGRKLQLSVRVEDAMYARLMAAHRSAKNRSMSDVLAELLCEALDARELAGRKSA